MKYTNEEITSAKESLSRLIKPGSTVFTVLRSASKSGMSRKIGVVTIHLQDGKPDYCLHPNYSTAVLLGLPADCVNNSVTMKGAGMDMGHELVSLLSYALFGDEKSLNHAWI